LLAASKFSDVKHQDYERQMQKKKLQSNVQRTGKTGTKKSKIEQTSYLTSSRNYRNNNLDEKLP
jgi:hypothetical protein